MKKFFFRKEPFYKNVATEKGQKLSQTWSKFDATLPSLQSDVNVHGKIKVTYCKRFVAD